MAERRAGSIAAFRAVIRHRKVGRPGGSVPARGARILFALPKVGKGHVIFKHVIIHDGREISRRLQPPERKSW